MVETRWKLMMSYEADKGSPELSNRILPVTPGKLTFLRDFCTSLPFTNGLTEGQSASFVVEQL